MLLSSISSGQYHFVRAITQHIEPTCWYMLISNVLNGQCHTLQRRILHCPRCEVCFFYYTADRPDGWLFVCGSVITIQIQCCAITTQYSSSSWPLLPKVPHLRGRRGGRSSLSPKAHADPWRHGEGCARVSAPVRQQHGQVRAKYEYWGENAAEHATEPILLVFGRGLVLGLGSGLEVWVCDNQSMPSLCPGP